jgi:hypothetical protein
MLPVEIVCQEGREGLGVANCFLTLGLTGYRRRDGYLSVIINILHCRSRSDSTLLRPEDCFATLNSTYSSRSKEPHGGAEDCRLNHFLERVITGPGLSLYHGKGELRVGVCEQ